MRVLVAEDSEDVRFVVESMLQHGGHTAVLASDGREAWELLNQGEIFDLIISDKDMPRMTGIEFLQRVRVDSRMADVPFILMSGERVVSDDDPTPLEEVCARHDATFMPKPFSLDGLLALLGVRLGD